MLARIAENELERDVAKAQVLSNYMRAWGAPSRRTVFRQGDSPLVEIYTFESPKLMRWCTIGLREFDTLGDPDNRVELLLPLDRSDPKATADFAVKLISDVAGNILNNVDTLEVPHLFGPSTDVSRVPPCVLLDEARGEVDEVARMKLGQVHVNLTWIIPIFEPEYRMILNKGVETFDQEVEARQIELVRLSRPSVA